MALFISIKALDVAHMTENNINNNNNNAKTPMRPTPARVADGAGFNSVELSPSKAFFCTKISSSSSRIS